MRIASIVRFLPGSSWRGVAPACSVIALAACATKPEAPKIETSKPSSSISIDVPVRVSAAHPDRGFRELQAAAHPTNANELMVCAMSNDLEASARWIVLYASYDGGKTWSTSIEDKRGKWVGDPTCTYGRGDSAYFSTLNGDMMGSNGNVPGKTSIYRSPNGGRTWEEPVYLDWKDRQYLVVDRTAGPHAGTLYYFWNGGGENAEKKHEGYVELRKSTDGAHTFSSVIHAGAKPHYVGTIPGKGLVMPNGMLAIPVLALTSDGKNFGEEIGLVTSTDGGKTLTTPLVVGEAGSNCFGMPDIAADTMSGPFKGRMYIVWGAEQRGQCNVMLSTSVDTGKTWSKAVMVSDDASLTPEGVPSKSFLPALAVNKDGVIGVVWYERVESGTTSNLRLRFASSLDGGRSFSASMPISRSGLEFKENSPLPLLTTSQKMKGEPITSTVEVDFHFLRFGAGDTQGFVADASGAFHPFWIETVDGMPQLYSTVLHVNGRASKNGDPSLDNFVDLTDSVTMTYGRTTYDPATHTFSIEVRLLNVGASLISDPLKVRAASLHSGIGRPRILNADNGEQGGGAIWDFSKAVPNDGLAPQKESEPLVLRFKVDDYDVRRLQSSTRITPAGVVLQSRVFGLKK